MRRINMRCASVRRIFAGTPPGRVSIGIALLLCAVAPASYPATALTIAGSMPLEDTLLVKIDGDLSPFSYYDIAFNIDPVLRNWIHGGATFNIWLFRFGIGAFFSTFDEEGIEYAPGIYGSIGLETPGVFSLYVEYGQNPVTDLSSEGNVNLNYGKLEAAIWLPHIRPRFIMQRKSMKVEPEDAPDLEYSLVRYQGLLDIYFKKSAPFWMTLGVGYETLTNITEPFPHLAPSLYRTEAETISLFVSFDASLKINPDFTLLLNVESPLAAQGEGALFKAAVGLKITLSNFLY